MWHYSANWRCYNSPRNVFPRKCFWVLRCYWKTQRNFLCHLCQPRIRISWEGLLYRKLISNEEQSGVCQELEIRETGVSDYKGSSWWQNSSVSWLWWWLHESIHVIKEHRIIHRHCTYVNFLAFIWNYNYVQCNHWGRLGEGQLPMSIIISK